MVAVSIDPLAADGVRLHPHTPTWLWRFWWERLRLWFSLPERVLKIEHVGSTAIPSMPAKPIIDILIVVRDFERASVCIRALERLGYEYKGENSQLRQHHLLKGSPTTHTLYLVEPDNEELAARVRFRDYLIAHPEAARAYAHLKVSLAERHAADLKAYQEGKLEFVKWIVEMANQGECYARSTESA